MKKITALFLVMVLLLTGCGNSSKLKIKGASKDQTAAIEKVLEDNNIKVKKCTEEKKDATDELTKALLELYAVYNVEDEDGKTYHMSIQKSDYTVFTIADDSGNMIYGDLFGGNSGNGSDENKAE